MKSFQDLPVWREANELVQMIHFAAQAIPEPEQEGLALEMRSISGRLPAFIARGFGMRTRADFLACLRKANRQITELEMRVMIAQGLEFFDECTSEGLLGMTDRVGRRLQRLMLQLESSPRPRPRRG